MARFAEHPIIQFHQSRAKGSARQRRYLLWPTLSYRVFAPRGVKRPLNLLQKGVLQLLMVSPMSHDELAMHLLIHPDLTRHIAHELRTHNFIDPHLQVTQAGRDVLQEMRSLELDLVTGHVFQDPWTGQLYPRFSEVLQYAEATSDERGIALEIGTPGAPRQLRTFAVEHPGRPHPTPSATDILEAIRLHQRAQRSDQQGLEERGEDEFSPAYFNAAVSRVRMIEDEPTPMYLLVPIYVPEEHAQGKSHVWQALDPFGLEGSNWLRERILSQGDQQHALRTYLLNLEGVRAEEAKAYQELLDELQVHAAKQIQERLGLRVADSAYYERLLAMERARAEAEYLGQACPTDKYHDLLSKAQIVLEQYFLDLLKQHPPVLPPERLQTRPHQKRIDADLLDAIAEDLGLPTPLPRYTYSVPLNRVLHVLRHHDGGSLMQYVIAALHASRENPDHPLRALGRMHPDWLERVTTLADMRNKGNHASKQRVQDHDVLETLEIVYALLDPTPVATPSH